MKTQIMLTLGFVASIHAGVQEEESLYKHTLALPVTAVSEWASEKQAAYEEEIAQLREQLTMYSVEGEQEGVAACYQMIGIIYKQHGEYEKALENLQAALTIQEELGDDLDIIHSFVHIGSTFNHQNQHEEALPHFLNALEIAQNLKDMELIEGICQHLSMTYTLLDQHEEAYRFQQIGSEVVFAQN